MIGKLRRVLKWVYVGLGLALAHWGLSWYAFMHYRTALTYYRRPAELLFDFTLTIPHYLEKHAPPDVAAIFRMLPLQSLLLATAFTLLLCVLWYRSGSQHSGRMDIHIGAVGLTLCFWLGLYVALAFCIGFINRRSQYWVRCEQYPVFYISHARPRMSFGPDDQPVFAMQYQHYPTLTVKTAWLNSFLSLPGQVLDIQYDLIAEFYMSGVRIQYADIAAKVPPAEVDRWRKLISNDCTPVTINPRIQCDASPTEIAWNQAITRPADVQWRHTSKPEYFNGYDHNCYLIIYRREGIVFYHEENSGISLDF